MYVDIKGKTAIVTGAARGIGAAVADLLSEMGALVVIADIDVKNAGLFAQELRNKGRSAYEQFADISDMDSIESMVEQTLQHSGKIDILVNNAGVIGSKSVHELELEDWDRLIDINLRGTFLCSKIVIREMIKNRSGKIVNIASLAGQTGGLKAGPDYSASKAGIISLAKSFARYGAPYGVNVNAVSPGFIETEMTKGRDDPNSVPIGRLGTPLDVAKAVLFLVSPLADYITGATVDVNGGLLMR